MRLLLARRAFGGAAPRAPHGRALSTLEAPRTYVEMERRDGEHAPLARDVRLLGRVLGDVLEARCAPEVMPVVAALRARARGFTQEPRYGEPMLAETRAALDAHFRPHNARLRALLGNRSLPAAWPQ